MTRYLVVGDVHGCRDELEELLATVGDTGRQLVLVGDVMGKGPDARGVIALCRARRALVVRGNHDEKALQWHRGGRDLAKANPGWLPLTDEDWDWLDSLPYHHRLEDVGALVVHAGLVPGVPLEAQETRHLISMRTLRPDGTPSKHLGDGELWASRWPGPELVVFGHDAITGLQQHPHAIGLDTGCVYGGRLTGLLLPERALVSVPAGAGRRVSG